PLPMFVNTWLRQGKDKPGEDIPGGYPSGGPLPQVLDAWRAGGPAIDILAPDVHVPNYAEWCAWYTQSGNPLFIPESRGDARGVAHAIATAGRYDGIGYSPFGIDRLASPDGELGKGYQVLSQVAPLILERQGLGKVTAVLVDQETPRSKVRLGDYTIEARFNQGRGPAPGSPAVGAADRGCEGAAGQLPLRAPFHRGPRPGAGSARRGSGGPRGRPVSAIGPGR